MAAIHPTAIVEDGARLGQDVEIGAYCMVGGQAVLGDGVRLLAHVVIDGRTEIGAKSVIFPFVCLGHEAQDIKSTGADTRLLIGANVVLREHCTIHRGTPDGGGVTRIGDNCYFMVNSHVAHDCQIGNQVIFSGAAVAGHVTIGDHVILGGHSSVHQFVRIGRYAMVGGMSGAELDIIPYGLAYGVREGLSGLNLVGLKRHSFSREEIQELRKAYRMLFGDEGTLAERKNLVAQQFADSPLVIEIIDFINAESSRPLMVPRRKRVR